MKKTKKLISKNRNPKFFPQSKFRAAALIVVGVLSIAIIGLIVAENNRHDKVMTSMNNLSSIALSRETSTWQTNGCARKADFGKSVIIRERYCQISVRAVRDNSTVSDTAELVNTFISIVDSSDEFTPLGEPINYNNETRHSLNYTYYKHEKTGAICEMFLNDVDKYWNDRTLVKAEIEFSCDDTSWYTKTFQSRDGLKFWTYVPFPSE